MTVTNDFNESKAYGEIVTTNDHQSWRLIANELAGRIVPNGTEVLIAVKDDQVAWRYPDDVALVPDGWEHSVVVTNG